MGSISLKIAPVFIIAALFCNAAKIFIKAQA
jgi:hypothetical protein